jgi:hypothetical protein
MSAEFQLPAAFPLPPPSFPTNSSISLNSADVVLLATPLFTLPCAGLKVAERPPPCAGLCDITDRPRPCSPDADADADADPPTLVAIPRFPRPVVMVDANDDRIAACGVSAAVRAAGLGDPVAVPRLSRGARGEAVRSDVVPRRSSGGRGLACDELREVDGLTVDDVVDLRSGSREAVLCVVSLPKIAGSMGFVRARCRGGVFGRCTEGVDREGVCVSARWRGGRVLRGRGARGAGVGDVAGAISGAGMASTLMS